MHPLQIATKKQHCTHIFLVTHWGASASKKPGPDNSRNTPLNRHIRSCQFDHPNLLSTSIHHHLFPQCPQIIYRASETATIHSANQIDLWNKATYKLETTIKHERRTQEEKNLNHANNGHVTSGASHIQWRQRIIINSQWISCSATTTFVRKKCLNFTEFMTWIYKNIPRWDDKKRTPTGQ